MHVWHSFDKIEYWPNSRRNQVRLARVRINKAKGKELSLQRTAGDDQQQSNDRQQATTTKNEDQNYKTFLTAEHKHKMFDVFDNGDTN